MKGMFAMLLVSVLGAIHAAEAAEPLTVMSFNIRYGKADDGENSWEFRKDIAVNVVKKYDPDLIGMQECLKFQAEYFAEQLPGYAWFGQGREADGGGEYTAIFYKRDLLTLKDSGTFWLSETPDVPGSKSWDASLTRIATWGAFEHAGTKETVYFYNTHFDHKGPESRRHSAELLRDRVESLPEDAPVIVTGDFNAKGGTSAPWKAITSGSIQDTWDTAEKQIGPPVTYTRFKAPEEGSNRRIDWVLTRGPVTADSCETVLYNEDGRYPTDHLPVVAVVRVGGR
jgi:endonuclease/exonuclease/phosphatase family metal-dependent hydrolase